MTNKEIAKIFYEIAQYLEMENVPFKPYAYQKAGISLESLEEDVRKIYQRGGLSALEEIPGVGKSIAQKIEEYLKTGRIKEYQNLKKGTPVNLEELVNVEGIGPKKVKVLYQKLKIKNLKDLEKAARAHKIAPLFGFGEKTEKNILVGIEFLKRSKGRFLLGEILPMIKEVFEELKSLKEVQEISTAGSVRRMKETIGDVDFLVTTKNLHPVRNRRFSNGAEKVMDFFVSLPGVIRVWGKGTTKSSVRMEDGFDMDIRVVPKNSYGSALQYFTGSKEHNIETRKIAIDKGLKLNEYGVFQGKKMIAGRNEKEVYKVLGLEWMPPEIRENQGEVELALKGKLPKIIGYQDIKGDLHCHSDWDGGANSILEMAKAAQGLGYEYIGIADHTKFLRIEYGLNEKQLSEQRKEIEKINAKIQNPRPPCSRLPSVCRRQIGQVATRSGQANVKSNPLDAKRTPRSVASKFQILQGCEANIMNDGSIDIKDEALKKLDYAIAGIHSSFKMPKEKMTERIIRAMKNPYIKIISHPTGRILKRRDEYQVDFDKILRAAKETKTILEINSYPQRLDLNDQNIRRAKEAGVKMVINTDSHQKDQLHFIELGIAQARRGWAEKKDIVNCWSLEKFPAPVLGSKTGAG